VHYTMWATLEIDSGNFREARVLLEEGSEKFPGDQFLLQRWGALESKFGSVKKARELFDRSIVIQPHAPTFVAWAILEEDQGILVSGSKSESILDTNEMISASHLVMYIDAATKLSPHH
jgi:predicted Zn-dependent protease